MHFTSGGMHGHSRATPIVISRGFHRGFQKGFQIPNESCDCIKYLNLGEFLITIMSSLSQEESRSISENVRWGIKKRMADGKYSVTYVVFRFTKDGQHIDFFAYKTADAIWRFGRIG